jgi:hypothetical protein
MYILSIFSVNTFVAFTLHHYFNDIKFYENAIFERNPFSAATTAVYPHLLRTSRCVAFPAHDAGRVSCKQKYSPKMAIQVHILVYLLHNNVEKLEPKLDLDKMSPTFLLSPNLFKLLIITFL